MKHYFILLIIFISSINIQAQNNLKDQLIAQGAWFLFSSQIDESYDDEKLTKIDFFKKDDVSSIYFDNEDKLFSVFSEEGDSNMLEDRWKIVDDTHFVIVSPLDSSSRIMDIVEISPTKLVVRTCSNLEENGEKCITYTYFSTKTGWLSDKEIDELNGAGIIKRNNI